MSATLLTVLRGGGRYDALWVERLFAGARAFAPAFERHLCLTDIDLPGIETAALRHGWPGWWSKMEAFRPGLASGTVVLCDLDTVFCGNADALAEPGLAAMEDFFLKGRVSSALVRFEADELGFVHERFAADPERWMRPGSCGKVPNAVHGDQVVLDHLLRERGLAVPFLQDRHPGLLAPYAPEAVFPAPAVIFIGDEKPDGATEPVGSFWRDASAPAHDPV